MTYTGGYIEQPEEEVRCDCGQLLLKLTREGLEVKCRRCKRIRLLRWLPLPPAEPRKKPKSSRPPRNPRSRAGD